MNDAVLVYRDVRYSWPGEPEPLFNQLDLTIPRGHITGLIGPNGSGKTTLLELALGWRQPDAGGVYLDGRRLDALPGRERGRSMALVPQEERLPFAYEVMEYVLLGRAAHLPPLATPGAEDRRIARDSLERTGIANLAGRVVNRLSGGETRLVLIARALTQQPRILLLDEPANHLDPANRERILGILRRLRDSGITLVMSSHEPDIMTRLADRVVLLRRGSPPAAGSPGEMIHPDRLEELYGVPVRIAEVEGRRLILWGVDG